MSNQILYARSRFLNHPALAPILSQYPQHNWEAQNIFCSRFNGSMTGICARTGDNVWGFRNDIVDEWGFRPPEYDPNFNKSFSDITDQRYHDLQRLKSDRPWIICWSGGVDSTVVITSILRNSTEEERKNIIVACNRISVYENPGFYFKFIEPNFQTMDSTYSNFGILSQTYYIIDGDPADQLNCGGQATRMGFVNIKDFQRNLWTDPDRLLDYMAEFAGSRMFAEWHYEKLTTNMKSVSVPLETYHDFFYWGFFNLFWIPALLRTSEYVETADREAQRRYFDNFIPWFESADYQLWSMTNNKYGIKFGSDLGQAKLEFKRYIHQLFNDEYYFRFKSKTDSTGRIGRSDPRRFCLLDDYTWLNIDTDIDRILELLPAHINV